MESSDEKPAANRLAESTSPYLLQHAHNPVDWYPWGSEAIDRAARENKPIFLSIGYSACHWCHVMERQSFENIRTARLMNEHFVNIKVDREERPDIDDLYMLATQISTGAGGWPMSVWLTPQLEPFFVGTYFPPDDALGRPGFPKLLMGLSQAWTTREKEVRAEAARIVEEVRRYAQRREAGAAGAVEVGRWLSQAIDEYKDSFDGEAGGLGTAPKFPPSQALLFWITLLETASCHGADASAPGTPPVAPTIELPTATREIVGRMITRTLDAMAAGGIHDQIGGGFARYSVDAQWHVPHFEKMLYDNAQLVVAYARAAVLFGRPDYQRVARRTLDFCLVELVTPDGGFSSALDADSEGHEGKFYAWTMREIQSVLPDSADADLIIKHFGVTARGNWEDGVNVLHIVRSVAELAAEHGVSTGQMQARVDQLCKRLLAARAVRVRPNLDDKILAGWNGLMISALSVAGRLFNEPRYLEAAHRAIGYLLIRHTGPKGRLQRASRGGKANIQAYLDDYAWLLNGLLDLIGSTVPTSLAGTMARRRAVDLADDLIDLFADPAGGFFFTAPGHEELFAKPKSIFDNATPSANGVAIRALLRLSGLSGMPRYRRAAEAALASFAAAIGRQPAQCPTVLTAILEDLAQTAAESRNQPATALVAPPSSDTDSGHQDGAHPAGPGDPTADAIAQLDDQPVMHLMAAPLPPLRRGVAQQLTLRLEIETGFFIHPAAPEDPEMFATLIRLRTDAPLLHEPLELPPAEKFQVGNAHIAGYRGMVEFHALLTAVADAAPGAYSVRVVVLAQPCSDRFCLPPARLSVDVAVQIEA